MGDVVGEKDVRDSVDINISHGKSTFNESYLSLPTNNGVQPALNSSGNGDGHSTTSSNTNVREGLDRGVVEEDGMEFDECPTPNHVLIMNIIIWNSMGALKPNF